MGQAGHEQLAGGVLYFLSVLLFCALLDAGERVSVDRRGKWWVQPTRDLFHLSGCAGAAVGLYLFGFGPSVAMIVATIECILLYGIYWLGGHLLRANRVLWFAASVAVFVAAVTLTASGEVRAFVDRLRAALL